MRLFKYIAPSRIDILVDNVIRFSPPQAFNDPFEMKPHLRAVADDGVLRQTIDDNIEALLAEGYEKQTSEIKSFFSFEEFTAFAKSKQSEIVTGVSEQARYVTPFIEETLHRDFEEFVGVLSLTEMPNNLLMWAHYASSHTGLVIEFDTSHDFFEQRLSEQDEFRYLRKVVYSVNRPHYTLSDLDNFEGFLSKSKEWEYEQEWHMLMPLRLAETILKSPSYDIHLFVLPPSAIKSVVIGCRASEELRSTVKDLLKQRSDLGHISLYQAEQSSIEYKVEYTES